MKRGLGEERRRGDYGWRSMGRRGSRGNKKVVGEVRGNEESKSRRSERK